MSHHDYLEGQQIQMRPTATFYGVIQAAMRMADTDNLELLRACWPAVWDELQSRYGALRGYLPEELVRLGTLADPLPATEEDEEDEEDHEN